MQFCPYWKRVREEIPPLGSSKAGDRTTGNKATISILLRWLHVFSADLYLISFGKKGYGG